MDLVFVHENRAQSTRFLFMELKSTGLDSLPSKQRSIMSRKRRRTMNDFHDEVLVEILLRLPLTSMFQCKSVSKRWLSLISTSYFA